VLAGLLPTVGDCVDGKAIIVTATKPEATPQASKIVKSGWIHYVVEA